MASDNLCLIVALAVSLVCAVYGFMELLKKKESAESDLGVLQRQFRGLGYLLLAPVLLSLGVGLCAAAGLVDLKMK